MRGAFGKPQGTVARVAIGQPLMSVRTHNKHKASVMEALRRTKFGAARRGQAAARLHGADQEDHEAHRRPRPGAPLRPTLVGSGQGTAAAINLQAQDSPNLTPKNIGLILLLLVFQYGPLIVEIGWTLLKNVGTLSGRLHIKPPPQQFDNLTIQPWLSRMFYPVKYSDSSLAE